MTMQKHVLVAMMLLACTTHAGEWKYGVTCTGGALSQISWEYSSDEAPTQFNSRVDFAQHVRAECAAACDANDLCTKANLIWDFKWLNGGNDNWGMSSCYLRTNECVGESDWQNNQDMYIKGGVAEAATPAPTIAQCTGKNIDRWDPDLGGCCDGLEMRTEPRNENDSWYCPKDDAQHGQTCYSTIQMCRDPTEFPAPAPVAEPTDAPSAMPTPAPTDVPTSAPTEADSEEGCENLTIQTNMLVSIKKGKKQKKTMNLEDDAKEDVCECAELCENAGYDIFQYYSKMKRGKVKTSCQCMNLTNKVKAKTKKDYTAGALSSAAEEAFSKFKVKTSKKDQKAGQ